MAKKSPSATHRSKTTPSPTPKIVSESKQIPAPVIAPPRLPSAWQLAKTAGQQLWKYRRLFIAIGLVYGLLSLVLVQGLGNNNDVPTLKNELNQIFIGHLATLASGLTVFVVLLGSAGSGSSSASGAYEFFLFLVASLAIIWALRQTSAGVVIRMRDAYYRGMYPLIPFLLVLLVIGAQLLPIVLGVGIYSLLITNGIATNSVERLAWGVLTCLSALLSLYWICSSIFALYIVTLPDMTPLKALRSARKLVRHRRWVIMRKLLFLPLALVLAAGIIMLPVIIWLTTVAQSVFFILTMSALIAAHGYIYTLYRELLNE